MYRSRPVTPEDARTEKRQRVFMDLTQPSPHRWPVVTDTAYPDARMHPQVRDYRGDVVDLTTPPHPRVEMLNPRPEVIRVSSSDARYVLASPGQTDVVGRAEGRTQPYPGYQHTDDGRERYCAQPAPGYDPLQPSLIQSPREARPAPVHQPVHDDVRRVHGPPHDYQSSQPVAPLRSPMYYQQADPGQYRLAYPNQTAQARLRYAPVHGAPAPVQQMPREERAKTNVQYMPIPRYAPAPANTTRGSQEQSDNRAYSVGQYYTG